MNKADSLAGNSKQLHALVSSRNVLCVHPILWHRIFKRPVLKDTDLIKWCLLLHEGVLKWNGNDF